MRNRRKSSKRFVFGLESLESRELLSNVLNYHNDQSSTGLNPTEVSLTPANVNANTFGKLFTAPLDGYVYAQPLIKTDVNITRGPSQGLHDVAYVATAHDSIYALDANTGQILWQNSVVDGTLPGLPGATSVTSVPATDTFSDDIVPEIGITSTPVIDPVTNTIYLVNNTKQIIGGVAHYVYQLHALDLGNGAEKFGGPMAFADTTGDNTNNTPVFVYGTGAGAVTVNGRSVVQLNALHQNQRPGLTLSNGNVYVAIGSRGDIQPYHGWLVSFNANTLALNGVFNTTPNSGIYRSDYVPDNGSGGLWEGGGAPVVDANGNIYVVTANGVFDGNNGASSSIPPAPGPVTGLDTNGFPSQGNYGDSYLKLVRDTTTTATNQNLNGWGFRVADYFTPFDQITMENTDADLGSGGILLLPTSAGSAAHPHLMIGAGKRGRAYLIDMDNMGKYGVSDSVVQEFELGSASFGTFAYINNTLYIAGLNGPLRAYHIANATITPVAASANTFGFPGSTPSISANGSTNAVVWALNNRGSTTHTPATLYAYDANNVGTELFDSNQAAGVNTALASVKFSSPTVANGKVYVGGQTGISVYGLLGQPPPPSSGTTYISSLTPTSATNGWGPVELNQSNGELAAGDGHTLTIAGVQYASGLGVHASSTVTYNLAGLYTQFVSDVGIDDETLGRGSVIFQVFGDGVKLYDSGTVLGGQAARHVNVSVAGVRTLQLTVLPAIPDISYDHADWAGAALSATSTPPPPPVTGAVNISSLTPTSATNGWGPIELNTSNGENAAGDGHTITIAGVTYISGLGVHASSNVTYNLAGAYSTFTSDVGIDDETGGRGSVIFQVIADGVTIYNSGTVLGGQAARHVSVSVAGVQTLQLVVLPTADGIDYDHADWAGAQLTSASTPTVTDTYLSDLTYTSATNAWGPVELDQSNGELAAGDGHTITLTDSSGAAVTYTKGLGVHAYSAITYALGGNYGQFVSDVGVDNETGGRGSVVFQVWGNYGSSANPNNFVKLFDSGVMTGGQAFKHVDVNVTGFQQLQLIVLPATTDISYDHADWAGARLLVTPPPPTNVTYISDLTYTSATNGWGPVELNLSNGELGSGDGHTITIAGVAYTSGLGVHAPSTVVYNLGGQYTTFQTDIGIDDETLGRGSVIFQVIADGVVVYNSGVVSGGQAARHVSVSVAGVQQLQLVVLPAVPDISYDHADWAGAQLIM